jgi:cytochrome P450
MFEWGHTRNGNALHVGGPFTPLARMTNSLGLRRATLAFLMEHSARADFYAVPIVAGRTLFYVGSTAGIRRVLVERVDSYTRADNFEVPMFVGAVGNGLLSTDRDLWRSLRRIQARPFSRSRVEQLEETIESHAAHVLSTWEAWRPTDDHVDLFPRLIALTAAISVKCFFDFDLSEPDALALAEALMTGQDHVFSDLFAAVPAPIWVPTPLNVRFRGALAVVERVFHRILRTRLASLDVARDDLLSALLAHPLDDRELRDQVVTAFVAAPENMATALAWSLHEIASRPELANGVAESEEYRARFLREILRLYPGAPVITRRVVHDDQIDGHRVEAGSYVVISPYVIHRDRRYWSNPSTFDVERREYDTQDGREERLRYIPFGIGPRRCIGDHFAQLVLGIVLRMLAERIEVVADPGRPAVPRPRINLRPAEGLWMRLGQRVPVRQRAAS